MENRELTIATAPKRTSIRWENTYTTKQDLTAQIYDPIPLNLTTAQYHALPKTEKDKTKDHGGYVAGHLKNGQRRKGHVLNRSIITLDIDNLPPTTNLPETLQKNLTCAWLAHTTTSHTENSPRWRILIWLTRDITADEYGAISRRLAQDINPGLVWFDATTFQPERFMYWPCATTDANYKAEVSRNKKDLNPDTCLNRYTDWHDTNTWPGINKDEAQVLERQKKNDGKYQNPNTKPGMIGAFNRAYTIPAAITKYIPETYAPGTTTNRWTYTGGTSTNGLIIYDNGHTAYSNHATDPAGEQRLTAFDLIRIHKFGHLDTDTAPHTPINKLPSYTAMTDLASQDPAARRENAADIAATIAETFQPITKKEKTNNNDENPQDLKDPTAWLDTLTTKKNGDIEDTLDNFIRIFTHDPRYNHISWNEHAGHIQVQDPNALPWKQLKTGWTENDDAQLKASISENYHSLYSPNRMHDALTATATARAFHPVRDYFNNLPPWDGIPRLDALLIDYLGAEDTDYVRAVTRKTLIAAIRRTFKPGTKFDHVLTTAGPQGIGKSTIWAKLAGQWFSDNLTISDMKDNKTAAEKLAGNLIVEISELAGMRKTEAEPVKGFISRTEDKYRPSYGRTVETYPRQCVIVGTTNAEDGFLRDNTGNRRWWTVHVTGNAPLKAHAMDHTTIDQIWAEAKHMEKKGESLYLTGALLQAAQQAQADSVESDDRTGLVAEYLEKSIPNNWDVIPLGARRIFLDGGGLPEHYRNSGRGEKLYKRASVSKIEIWAECFGRDPDAMRRADSYDIASIMQQLDGWEDNGKRQHLPYYGRQRIYERSHVRVA
ncbi:virulence-associated E family protein [Corynebacterium ulcerans]|uniref:virulence-associated E family protein n=1 Tax=Corynebacterium ulcerans TaxID=65058 RepID=UPI0018DA22A5|nr:virulence-associated E family protein [Corynebacterium ulcerans]MBH5303495.1 hypothetical protein [Corynebacterium ulcerans]